MAISPGMIKILGSIASSAMSSKGKEESKPKPKLNSNFLIDDDKQASQAPLNINTQTASAMVNVVNLNSTKRGQKLSKRLTKRNLKRSERIDNRELRRKARFESRDANKGKTYQEKRGTDVGNFFRRFNDPGASQTAPSTTTNSNNSAYDNYQQKLSTQFLLERDKVSAYQQKKDEGSYKDWLYKDVELAPINKKKNK
jgi:hypothetical protein